MKILFRCDATPKTGLGHLSRSLALAEALRRRGAGCHFVGHWAGAAWRMLDAAGFSHALATTRTGSLADADEVAKAAEGGTGVVADSYALDAAWLTRLAQRGVPLVLCDDFARLPGYGSCAGVINFTVGAAQLSYPGLPAEAAALGPRYFPARECLLGVRRRIAARPTRRARRVLITLGGGDVRGMTLPLYHALKKLDATLEVRALLPNGAVLAANSGLPAADFPEQASDLAAHYGWADRVISGGGLTKYECGYLGLSMAICSQTPEQQTETERFCRAGVGFDLGADDDWEARLADFVADPAQGPRANEAAHTMFPSDSADRAAQAVQRFLGRAAVPVDHLDVQFA